MKGQNIKRLLGYAFGIPMFLAGVYFLGPRPNKPKLDSTLPKISGSLQDLELMIGEKENHQVNMKPDNFARIVWADPLQKQKTEYSVVYLHGFTASHEEGAPVHLDFARRYGCNLFLSRLYGHGLESKDALHDLTPENWLESAKEAIAIGKRLGKKVIVMATSTGASLALYLAAHRQDIHSLILYSPNIDLKDSRSFLFTQPWGLQFLQVAHGLSSYRKVKAEGKVKQYWTDEYRVEALVAIKNLVDNTMTPETFAQIDQPLFMGYYYKNEELQDTSISVPRALEMFEQISTPSEQKHAVAFPNADSHVLSSYMFSHAIERVEARTFQFAEEVLGLKPVIVLDSVKKGVS